MAEANVKMDVRKLADHASIVDIKGEVTAAAEGALTSAYDEASQGSVSKIVLNFTDLDYMNSTGIGLLVTLLVRAQRHRQDLIAYGLTDHYREIFELTRLDEAVKIMDSEQDALAAAGVN